VPGPASRPATWPRLFRALYSQFELRTFGDLHVAVPKGTPWYAGHSLTEVACQISAVPHPGSECELCGQPRCPAAGTSI
jgi:hypothetical protein